MPTVYIVILVLAFAVAVVASLASVYSRSTMPTGTPPRAPRSYPRKPCSLCGRVIAHSHDGTRPWHKHKCQPPLPLEPGPSMIPPDRGLAE